MRICEKSYSSFHKWYPFFEKQTFKSIIVEIPAEVLAYLNEDGIVLPVEAVSDKQTDTHKFYGDISDNGSLSDGHEIDQNSDDGDTEIDTVEQPSFPAFSQELQLAIDALGGSVFIKGNWSAPTDASWIIPNKNLKCSSIEDIYLLLNSSSRLQDNFNSLKSEDTHYIVIKKWEDICPSSEFRCFVCNNSLIGISQRDCSDMHSYIPDAKMDIIRDVTKFFTKYLKNSCLLSTYTFDVIRLPSGKVTLVDIGLFDKEFSKSYLFSWDELIEISNSNREVDQPEFRYIASTTGVQPNDAFTGFCLPYDLTNISSSKQVIDSLVDLLETEVKLQDEE